MNENTFIEVSDILDSFDIDEIRGIINDQINNHFDDDVYTEKMHDYLKPLYYNYARLSKYSLDEDTKEKAESKFYAICIAFLQAILGKFNIDLDKEWVSDHYSDLPAITIAFYTFFVLDFESNVYEVLVNYINANSELVAKTFEGLKIKKDASTLSNKKNLSPQMALIISNIYDISEWIFGQLDESDYFKYIDNSYVPLQLIKALYENEYLTGEFADVILQILHINIPLKSKICFDFIYQVKNGEIKDEFTKEPEEEK